jgi:hypothetical protein
MFYTFNIAEYVSVINVFIYRRVLLRQVIYSCHKDNLNLVPFDVLQDLNDVLTNVMWVYICLTLSILTFRGRGSAE